MERLFCHKNPSYYLSKYGKVKDELGGIVPFTIPLHITELTELLYKYRLTVILKARQIYFTWLTAGLSEHTANFQEASKILHLSKNGRTAEIALGYAKFIHSQLPDHLREEVGHTQESLVDFPKMQSEINALPSTTDAAVGFGGATWAFFDEYDFHDYEKAAQNYAETKPTIDRGGRMTLGSAPNKFNQDTKFKEIWYAAREGGKWVRSESGKLWIHDRVGPNGFFPIFIPYDVLPYRDKDWYEQQKIEYDQWDLEGRYPKTEEEALSAPKLSQRFDVEALNDMEGDCGPPVKEEYNGIVKIYKPSVAGKKYCFAIDPSEGMDDPSCGIIMDDTFEQVAEFHGKIPIDEQARIVFDLWNRYNRAFIAPEANAAGVLLVEKLKAMGVNTFYYTNKDRAGWWTSSYLRPIMITDLAENIRLRQLKVRNIEIIKELRNFIRTKKKPEGEARGGTHDDRVMTIAILLQIRKKMPSGTVRIRSFQYSEG